MKTKRKIILSLVLVLLFAAIMSATASAAFSDKNVTAFADGEIVAEVQTGAEKGGKKYCPAYLGETIDKELIAKSIAVYRLVNGSRGDKIAITAANIGDADLSKEGETSVTVTADGYTCLVPVYVYKTEVIQPLEPDHILSWSSAFNLYFESQITGSESTIIATTNIISETKYGIPQDMVTLRTPTLYDGNKEYKLHTVGHVSQKQMLVYFSNINAGDLSDLPIGSVLSLNDNFRFYRYIDGTYIAAYKLNGAAGYVWTGDSWANFVADTTDFELSTESIELPAGASYPLGYTLKPEGSYIEAKISSSNESVAIIENGRVRCLKEGTAEIIVSVGTKTKKVSITVSKGTVKGFKLADDRMYYLSEGSDFDLSKIKVTPDFGNGVYGDEFVLNEQNASYDKSLLKEGENELSISVDNGGVTGTVTLNVCVVKAKELVPVNFWSADQSGNFFGAIVIHFSGDYDNSANLYLKYLTEQEKTDVLNNIEFIRDGKKAEIAGVEFMTSLLTIDVKINGVSVKNYKAGDRLVLKEGLKLYKWTGEIANATPKGSGDFVATGVIGSDIEYVYGKNGTFKQNIQYKSIGKVKDVVYLELNEKADCNVYSMPGYATVGEWFFVVEDESIVSVDVNGNMTAKNAGRTTVHAYLEGGLVGELTLSYDVVVADSVLSYGINAKELSITTEDDLNGTLFEKLGIKGYIRYVSGKTQTIALTGCTITGFDKTVKDAQTVKITFKVGETEYSSDLIVKVTEKGKNTDNTGNNGCKGDISSFAFTGAFTFLIAAVVITAFKKKTCND